MDDTFNDLIDLSSVDSHTFKQPSTSIASVISVNTNKTQCEASPNKSATVSQTTLEESRRTREKIDEFETQLECFIKTKRLLLEHFAEETNSLVKKHEREINALRQKHAVCEDNFKNQLENSNSKYNQLEQKYVAEQSSNRLKISSYEEEIARLRQQFNSDKENFDNVLNDKERTINELKNEKFHLDSQIKLQKSEFFNRRRQLDEEIKQLKSNQEKDLQEIKRLKDDLSASNRDTVQLHQQMKELTEKLRQNESAYVVLKEESNRLRNQIEIESKAKQEKIDRIHSLTVTLNESKAEIDSLQKNFSELETKRTNEVKELEKQLRFKQANYDQLQEQAKDERLQVEVKLRKEIEKVENHSRVLQSEIQRLKSDAEKYQEEKESSKQQYETLLGTLRSELDSLEQSSNDTILGLNDQVRQLEELLTTQSTKYDFSQSELTKTKNGLASAENELRIKKEELLSVNEKHNLLELDRSSILAELDNTKRLLQGEAAEKKEKQRLIQNLNDSLSTSQFEIEKLKDANEQLERSLREGDELRSSLLSDCNDLRATLAEVEKSRLEIKSKLNSFQFSCVSTENKLKMKETELNDLNIKINSLMEEKKLLQDSLDSASKSLTQMKNLNERLHQQNVGLQGKMESVRLETDRKINSNSNLFTDKDHEVKRLKREVEQLRERNLKLESEKRRFERSYVNLEKDYASLKNTIKPSSAQQTMASPSRLPSDQSRSVLSLTQLLSETNFLNSNLGSAKRDTIFDETMNITRSLEALEQKNMELQQKVLGLQNLMDAASSESDLNTTKNSDEFTEYQKVNGKSIQLENNLEIEDGMYPDENHNIYCEEKLKLAQMKAQNLIESYDKKSKTRTQSTERRKSAEKATSTTDKTSSPVTFNTRIASSYGRRNGAAKKAAS